MMGDGNISGAPYALIPFFSNFWGFFLYFYGFFEDSVFQKWRAERSGCSTEAEEDVDDEDVEDVAPKPL